VSVIIFGLGSNLGNKKSNIMKAGKLLKKSFGASNFLGSSSLIKTKPLVLNSSPQVYSRLYYLNSAIAFNVKTPIKLVLKKIKKIEERLGRKKITRWCPRKIDIDVLIYQNNEIQSSKINIPHKELLNRSFALIPLIEILDTLKLENDFYKKALNTLF
jgi:2-amino-4-hydroxy-6-hydroxymethyldihydropteridine diphosphokinase